MGGKTKVLIAVDGSEQSEKALRWYLDHLYHEGDTLFLGHVLEDIIEPSFGFRAGMALPREQWQAMLNDKEAQVNKLKHKYEAILAEKHVHGKFLREFGKPGVHLVEMAEKEKVDLIVMGTRGLGTVRRTILGSVSDYIIHHTHAQVCIVKE